MNPKDSLTGARSAARASPSPLVASVFALAGGAGEVKYPAQTLYQNQKLLPASLHDVNASATSGSNGKCSKPFNEETFLTGCTPEQEATASCSLQLICLAHSGYDGPSGVGTPHGLEAFKALSPEETDQLAQIEAKERAEAQAAAEAGSAAEAQAAAEATARAQATLRAEERALEEARLQAEAKARPAVSATPTPTPAPSAAAASLRVSTLALTQRALVALNTRRPNLSQVGFSFVASAAMTVHVVLARQVRTHGRLRWQQLHAYKLGAVRGTNSKHLSGRGWLAAGDYRLTLAPSDGARCRSCSSSASSRRRRVTPAPRARSNARSSVRPAYGLRSASRSAPAPGAD